MFICSLNAKIGEIEGFLNGDAVKYRNYKENHENSNFK